MILSYNKKNFLPKHQTIINKTWTSVLFRFILKHAGFKIMEQDKDERKFKAITKSKPTENKIIKKPTRSRNELSNISKQLIHKDPTCGSS